MKTMHSIQRIIKDIKNDDVFIQVTGYIREIIDDDTFILDDDTGQIKVKAQDLNINFEKGALINVIGDLNYNVEGEKSIEAIIIQDMNNLNFKYYKKLYDLKKQFL
ncbi:MAG: hypothetical protein ACTSVV_13045 [Promethearchaeota archaeon]